MQHTYVETVNKAHGRIEIRRCWALGDPVAFDYIRQDMTFGEADSRIRTGDSPQNMAVLRHLALNILKRDKSKGSLRQKRSKAALDDTFLSKLLDRV